MFAKKAREYVNLNTTRRSDIEYKMAERAMEMLSPNAKAKGMQVHDPFNQRKPTTEPTARNRSNRTLVTEGLVRSEVFKHDQDRTVVDTDHFWKAMDLITQQVKGTAKTKFDPNSEQNKKLEDQIAIQNMELLFRTLAKKDKKNKQNNENAPNDETYEDIELRYDENVSVFDDRSVPLDTSSASDLDMHGLLDSDAIDAEETEEEDKTVKHEPTNSSQEFTTVSESTFDKLIEKQEIKDNERVEMNQFLYVDYHYLGTEMMLSQKLCESREQHQNRKQREEHFLIDKLYDRLCAMEDDHALNDITFKPATESMKLTYTQQEFQDLKNKYKN